MDNLETNFFENVKQLTEASRQNKLTISNEEKLTEEEISAIDYWIIDIESHIEKKAQKGKTVFKYDCSKIRKELFEELSLAFKERHKEFMVIRDYGRKWLVFDWSGSHEV